MNQDQDCLFCKIARKELKANLLAENDEFLAIRDINPQAPTHILIMPKKHVANISLFEHTEELGRLFQAATNLAKTENLENGFRLVVNSGPDAGQSVDHLHIHLLGGRSLGWPPG